MEMGLFICLLNHYVAVAFGVLLVWFLFTPSVKIKEKIKKITKNIKNLFKK